MACDLSKAGWSWGYCSAVTRDCCHGLKRSQMAADSARQSYAGHKRTTSSQTLAGSAWLDFKAAAICAQLFKYCVNSRPRFSYEPVATPNWSSRLSPRVSQDRFFLVTQM